MYNSVLQRDLAVLGHESQQVSLQLQQVIRKTNGMLVFITRRMEYKNREVLLQLYRVSVKPHLEYYVQFRSPYFKKDIIVLEAVQRSFTRHIPGVRGYLMKKSWTGWA